MPIIMSWIWIDDKKGRVMANTNIWGLYLEISEKLDHMGFKVLFEIETAVNTYIIVRLE